MTRSQKHVHRVIHVIRWSLLLFIPNYKQTQSATVPASLSSTKSSQQLSQQVNKCSEVKYGVFRVKFKVQKEQTAECTRVQHGQWAYWMEVQDLNPWPRQQGKYNQCGRGFTTIPSQPQVITAKCVKFPSIYRSYSIEHYCVSSRPADHQSIAWNTLSCEWLCTEPFTGTMIQWTGERATSEFTATIRNDMNVMRMERR